MLYRSIHIKPLLLWLLPGYDNVDKVAAPQAFVSYVEECICIRRQVHPDNIGFFIDDVIDKARVLVAESVVILTPDMGCQEIVQ